MTGVYNINSTGQIMPLVTGIGVLLISISKATEPGNRVNLNAFAYGGGDVELSTGENGAEYESLSNSAERNNQI